MNLYYKVAIYVFLLAVTSILPEEKRANQASEALRRQLSVEDPKTSFGSELYPEDQKFTKEIDLETAESLLWKNNLLLIASRFQVDVKRLEFYKLAFMQTPISQSIKVFLRNRHRDTSTRLDQGNLLFKFSKSFC